MASVFIKNATVVTMDKKRRIIKSGAVAIEDDKIVAVGKTEALKKEYNNSDKVIDANGNILMPGLVNTHTHLFQSLGKNLGTDVDLLSWFKAAWAPLVEGLRDEDYYNAVKLGCLEAIKTGTTTILGYEHALNAHPRAVDKVIRALLESKIRAILGYGYQDTGEEIGAPKIALRETSEIIHDLERILDVAQHFRVPAVVCINKYDINKENTEKIELYCKSNNIQIVGKLPYNTIVTEAMIHEKTVIEYTKDDFSKLIVDMWNKVKENLGI